MKKLWCVIVYEYRRNTFKKSFLLVLASVPLFIVFLIGLGLFLENAKDNSLPVGVVDRAEIFFPESGGESLRDAWIENNNEAIRFIRFQAEEEAKESLQGNEIQAYYLIPADYAKSRRIEQVYFEEPGNNAERQFFDFLQMGVIEGQTPEITYRAAAGTDVTVRSVDGRREVNDDGPSFGLMMPLFITMAFLFMLLMSSGYVMGAITEEKENRTMEVLVTSISPFQLIAGKVFGILGVSITLLTVWSGVIVIGIGTARWMEIAWFNNLAMDWRAIFATIGIAVPSYVLAIALMTAIGAIVTKMEEGQSLSAIFIFLHVIPLYVSWSFINNPHGTLAVTLSLLPFTSLMTVGTRNLFTIVPAWQIVASVVIQTLFAIGALWIAGRAVRLGMLQYGQRLAFPKLFKSIN